ncbi:toprim domain-containing protein [Paenibacillus doosanensis]|uniref:DnaB-like helicase C-terminal domain-containing protein n=1 Tax=Paenibacillus doosanensis TaxID=1229154 RepID=UPI00217FA86B|nr:DnaB-like helicase C-terminal domain-containing protein [Paenibacillus doosanensis]MCS7462438.1 toprim domain-containing protein [Paenibacillus doosanensis]
MVKNISMETVKSSVDLEEMVGQYQKQLGEAAYAYLEKRGIEQETIEQYRIGYAPGKIGFHVSEHFVSDFFANRIIIPVTNADEETVDLIGRSIDHREPKYKTLIGVEDYMFNEQILAETEDVILCNGVFDVLSLYQARLPAVCVPYWFGFKEQHAVKLSGKRVFICLGNDELGRRESVRIQTLLHETAQEAYIVNLPETIRDLNDFFVRAQNPLDTFMQILNHTMEEAMLVPVAPDVKNLTVYAEEYMKRYRGQVYGLSSGFYGLDRALYGGFRSGLYLICGAASSGKTMLMKQMADHIAGLQNPVVYVSWDMTGFELWARSIARTLGVEPQQILNGKLDPERINEAIQSYMPVSKNMWTLECSPDTTLDKVLASIGKIAGLAGKTPVVFIDHLKRVPVRMVQDHAPAATLTERQTYIAYALKQWSKESSAVIVAALPGEYEQQRIPDGMEACADVIMMLKREGTAHHDNVHSVSLDLVKNRNGTPAHIPLDFQQQKAVFTEQ